jgi:hypothetical protein
MQTSKSFLVGLAAFSALVLSGCGGENGPETSTVTGSVLYLAGVGDLQPLRDARVESCGRTTSTSTTGAYFFENLPAGDIEVVAEGSVNGTRYVGRTVIFNLESTQQNSVNVMVSPASEVNTLRGTVRDRQGFLLQGASVFANVGGGGSIRAVTNEDGVYVMRDVPSGNITLSATGRGFRSDQDVISLGQRQDRTIDFVLSDPGIPNLNPPSITFASTFVSHPDATRSNGSASALAWVRRHLNPDATTPAATSRSLRTDMIVEADFEWNTIQFADLLGFNVYRGLGSNGAVSAIDLAFDPLANYYVDLGLQPQSVYSYAFSTVATLYPDFNNTESALSPRVVVETLDLLNINAVQGLTFSWQGGSGASEYQVFIFDGFPTAGANFLYDSPVVNGLSWVYNGPSLQVGRTYYYIVLGTANGGSSRTISQIGTFVR